MGLTKHDNIGESATAATIGDYIRSRKPPDNMHVTTGSTKVPITFTVLHNSATPQAQDKGMETVIGFHKYHQSRTWRCIGYHFVISVDGTIWAGRKMDEMGAHAGSGGNPGSIGVCLVGNFDEADRPTRAQIEAFVALHHALVAQVYPTGPITVHTHREFMNTSCPGRNLTDREINGWLVGNTPQPVPTPAPPTPAPEVTGIWLDGERIADAQVIAGTTWAPVRAVGQALGVEVHWQPPGRVELVIPKPDKDDA
jgi:N-acetylmuramoyl-L-alanine amidase